MTGSQPFTFITRTEEKDAPLFEEYHDLTSGHQSDIDVQILSKLREQYPNLIVTAVPASNCNLTQYALSGNATIELDLESDSIVRYRGFIPPSKRGEHGQLGDAVEFAKFHYVWQGIVFTLYTVASAVAGTQFILAEPRNGESPLGYSSSTDSLLRAIGDWAGSDQDVVYVFDGTWRKDKDLWKQVQKASWDKVILDPNMKEELVEVASKFFDSEEVYKQFGVPWKRGLIFYGPPGNGKTISVTTLMHSLYQRKDPIPSLYVKSVYNTYACRQVFSMARNMSPCVLVMEDLENIVYGSDRSYFFNEIDGLENNNGILFIGTTNYIQRLDPGITKRPSRFDRKYLFPLPSNDEREQYCEWWRKKIQKNPKVDYPRKLVKLIAAITFGFSFAYMQEAFIATLLELARRQAIDLGDIGLNDQGWTNMASDTLDGEVDEEDDDDDDDDIDKLPFWRVIREQVSVLRDDLQRNVAEDDEEREPGMLSIGKSYFDTTLSGIFQGIAKYFQVGSGLDVDSTGVDAHASDAWHDGLHAPPEMRKGTHLEAPRTAHRARTELPILKLPTKI